MEQDKTNQQPAMHSVSLLAEIRTLATYLDTEQIQILLDLSDDDMASYDIQYAIKLGEVDAVKYAGELIRNAANEGKAWAIKMLFDINKGKQNNKKYSFSYENKDAAALSEAVEASKTNELAQMAAGAFNND